MTDESNIDGAADMTPAEVRRYNRTIYLFHVFVFVFVGVTCWLALT